MWCLELITLLLAFIIKVKEVVPTASPTPVTSKSVGVDEDISISTDTRYLSNNTKLEARCIVRGKVKGLQKLQFYNLDNVVLTNTTRRKIYMKEDKVKNETIADLVWNPMYVKDNKGVPGVFCRNELTHSAKQFNIVVIPTVSIPKMTLSDTNIKIEPGAGRIVKCVVSGEKSEIVTDFSANWCYGDLNKKCELSSNTKRTTLKEGLKVTATLNITNANSSNVGKYYCISFLELKDKGWENIRLYHKVLYVEVPRKSSSAPKKVLIKKKEGDDVILDCEAVGSKVTWTKKDEYSNETSSMPPNGERYSYGNKGSEKNQFKIKEVKYQDRSLYICHSVLSENVTETTIFTLRVADPLGPVWPVLGIVAEALVLVIIIWFSEFNTKRKVKKEKKALVSHGENPKPKGPQKVNLDTEDAPLVS